MAVHPGLTPGYRADRNPGLDANAIYAGAESGDITALYIVGADPVGDGLMPGRGAPISWLCRSCSRRKRHSLPMLSCRRKVGWNATAFTNGERRVQRYNPAIQKVGDSRPDWQILAQVIEKSQTAREDTLCGQSGLFKEIAKSRRARTKTWIIARSARSSNNSRRWAAMISIMVAPVTRMKRVSDNNGQLQAESKTQKAVRCTGIGRDATGGTCAARRRALYAWHTQSIFRIAARTYGKADGDAALR